jgi:hypothetical protein
MCDYTWLFYSFHEKAECFFCWDSAYLHPVLLKSTGRVCILCLLSKLSLVICMENRLELPMQCRKLAQLKEYPAVKFRN